MNIFKLDETPEKSAVMHCDKHCVKMILETAQMLSTCHNYYGSWTEEMYKPTHKNHPCNKWLIQSSENYNWLYKLFGHLLLEYTKRYNKVHKCQRLFKLLENNPCPKGELTPFAQAMPEQYKSENDIKAYRDYYIGDKAYMAKWKLGNVPEWFIV